MSLAESLRVRVPARVLLTRSLAHGEVDSPWSKDIDRQRDAFAADVRRLRKAAWPDAPRLTIAEALQSVGDAERKAAVRLGRGADEVALAAYRLFGESLESHRDRLVAGGSRDDDTTRTIQARRGHVTRALVEQIESVLANPKKEI